MQVLYEMMTDLSEQCYLAVLSETTNPAVFQYAVTQIKDKLLEALGLAKSLFVVVRIRSFSCG